MTYGQINQLLSRNNLICVDKDFDEVADKLKHLRFHDELLSRNFDAKSLRSFISDVMIAVKELNEIELNKECPLCGFDKIRTISIYNPYNMSLKITKENEKHIIAYPVISVKCPKCDKQGEQIIKDYFNQALRLGHGSNFIAHLELFGRLEQTAYILRTCINPDEFTLLVHRATELIEKSQQMDSLEKFDMINIEQGA